MVVARLTCPFIVLHIPRAFLHQQLDGIGGHSQDVVWNHTVVSDATVHLVQLNDTRTQYVAMDTNVSAVSPSLRIATDEVEPADLGEFNRFVVIFEHRADGCLEAGRNGAFAPLVKLLTQVADEEVDELFRCLGKGLVEVRCPRFERVMR